MNAVVSLAGPAVRRLLADWLPAQRWWPAKGRAVTLEPVGRLRLPSVEAGVEVETLLLATGAGGEDIVQAPLTCRPAPAAGLDGALVGVLPDHDGPSWIYDGAQDPAYVSALLWLLDTESTLHWNRVEVRGVRHGDAPVPPPGSPAQLLRGEQSNSSIVVTPADGAGPVILKLFRVLRPGDNPDIALTAALAAGGCARVPRPVGWLAGRWPDPSGAGALSGQLAYACEFLPGSGDAWHEACRAVAAGAPFAAEAAQIAAATAEVHATLAAVLPSEPASPASLRALAGHLRGRLAWAVAAVPPLRKLAPAATHLYDQVAALDPDPARAPLWQRVHGDLHLGQVLHSPARGWILFDFEGEPLTPMAQRTRPDLALRDVAGMLRSFDYAARHETEDLPDGHPATAFARQWTRRCREAFLTSYRAVAHPGRPEPDPGEEILLRAFEVDKALYEVVYETGNRPHWVNRPLDALRAALSDR